MGLTTRASNDHDRGQFFLVAIFTGFVVLYQRHPILAVCLFVLVAAVILLVVLQLAKEAANQENGAHVTKRELSTSKSSTNSQRSHRIPVITVTFAPYWDDFDSVSVPVQDKSRLWVPLPKFLFSETDDDNNNQEHLENLKGLKATVSAPNPKSSCTNNDPVQPEKSPKMCSLKSTKSAPITVAASSQLPSSRSTSSEISVMSNWIPNLASANEAKQEGEGLMVDRDDLEVNGSESRDGSVVAPVPGSTTNNGENPTSEQGSKLSFQDENTKKSKNIYEDVGLVAASVDSKGSHAERNAKSASGKLARNSCDSMKHDETRSLPKHRKSFRKLVKKITAMSF
eukprot:comp12374_c0_seq1/m.7264 comp12374_c0_seq1/g.7264  ORF comp12374_c0_seq1/g.7264 comp12374_c0_seq1/m.7264 type:complete len:341 (-) comp12374_c0_seq1:430-1452(-)